MQLNQWSCISAEYQNEIQCILQNIKMQILHDQHQGLYSLQYLVKSQSREIQV